MPQPPKDLNAALGANAPSGIDLNELRTQIVQSVCSTSPLGRDFHGRRIYAERREELRNVYARRGQHPVTASLQPRINGCNKARIHGRRKLVRRRLAL